MHLPKNYALPGALLVALCCSCRQPETVVSVRFKNMEGKTASLLRPFDGQWLGATDTIREISPDSVYTFRIDASQPVFVRLVAGRTPIDFIAGPGDCIAVDYDPARSEQPYRFSGDNATAAALYNELASGKNEIYRYEFINDFTRAPLDTVPEKVDTYFHDKAGREIARFDSLLARKEISRPVAELIRGDIRLYYTAVLSKIARAGCEHEPYRKAYETYWKQLHTDYPPEKMHPASQWFYDYAKIHLQFQVPYFEEKAGQAPPEIKSYADLYGWLYNQYSIHLNDKKIKETLLGCELYYQALNNKTCDTTLMRYFDRYRQEYPGNPYSARLLPFEQELKRYTEKIRLDFSPEVRFVENYDRLNTLKEVLEQFRGKPVFIDLWFSECGPCREEFQYNAPLKAFLKQRGVELLYLSVDRDDRHANWENSIKYFDLDGYHVRCSQTLWEDMEKHYQLRAFPTYMLAGPDGSVVLLRAKRPSEGQALFDQIDRALGKHIN